MESYNGFLGVENDYSKKKKKKKKQGGLREVVGARSWVKICKYYLKKIKWRAIRDREHVGDALNTYIYVV